MKQLKEREKMPALRISEDAVLNARQTFPEGTVERDFFENVYMARIPYALIARLANLSHADVRDMVTGRKKYTDETRDTLCVKVNRLIDKGLDLGLYPCSDLAVIEPLTMTLLSSMANERRCEAMKQKMIEAGLLPATQ